MLKKSLDDMTFKEMKEQLAKVPQKVSYSRTPLRIVVLQRGWVVIGHFSKKGSECLLEDASVIRNWGTSKGLPQLVIGPVEGKTILDKSATPIRFHELTVILMLDCQEEGWKGKL